MTLEARVKKLEEKVFPDAEKPTPEVPAYSPDITLAEARKLGKIEWHETAEGRFTAVTNSGRRVSIDAEEYAALKK